MIRVPQNHKLSYYLSWGRNTGRSIGLKQHIPSSAYLRDLTERFNLSQLWFLICNMVVTVLLIADNALRMMQHVLSAQLPNHATSYNYMMYNIVQVSYCALFMFCDGYLQHLKKTKKLQFPNLFLTSLEVTKWISCYAF